MTKEEIIKNIHTLVSNNVIGDKQLFSRYKGFRTELLFELFCEEKYSKSKLLKGGIIISKDNSVSSLNNSIYFTVCTQKEQIHSYKAIYSKLSKLKFIEMYLIFYDDKNWKDKPVMIFPNETIKLPVPEFNILEFNAKENVFIEKGNNETIITDHFDNVKLRNKNSLPIKEKTKEWLLDNLIHFESKDVLDIYMNRLFFDGYIGFSKNKGKSSDIDLIAKKSNGDLKLIEIKEKDLPKSNDKGFGLDVPRLKDFILIQEKSDLEYHLIVREINNQKERKLLNWMHVSITNFQNNVKDKKEVMGGTGMRSKNSKNPTKICDYDMFNNI